MTVKIVEFLYRGRLPYENLPETWHVVVGEQTADGRPLPPLGPFAPAEAEARFGLTLSSISSAINRAALDQASAARAALEEHEAEASAVRNENSQLQKELEAANSELDALRAAIAAASGGTDEKRSLMSLITFGLVK